MKCKRSVIQIKHLMLISIISVVGFSCSEQDKSEWNGKQAAVVLTYDDALTEHLDNAIPLLNDLGLKATFYVVGNFQGFSGHTNEWKLVAEQGHELGNHTLFHPCEGNAPGREWVNPDYNLSDYTVQRMVDEISTANLVLSILDGQSTRTFAYPCGDTMAGDASYVGEIKDKFVGARGVAAGIQKINEIDLYSIQSYMINGQSGEELIELVKQAIDENALLVFLFHGVGGGHSIDVSLQAHQELLMFLKQNEQKIWVAPLVDIAKHIKVNRQGKLKS